MKLTAAALTVALASASCCPPGETDTGEGGSAEVTTVTTASTSTSTPTEGCSGAGGADPGCVLPPAPGDCSAEYTSPLHTFEPGEPVGASLAPLPGEAPWGAAAGRADVAAGYVTALHLPFVYGTPPSVVRVAVWQEPACGLPATPAADLPWVDPDPAGVDPLQDGRWRVVLPDYVALDPEAGYTWVAVALTWFDVSVWTRSSAAGPEEPRFAWYGLTDRDCDGEPDPDLGWEDVRSRSYVGAGSADADLAADLEMFDGVPN